ncbi:nitrophenyl compound nitroreductase subunit ArsF family protein [Bythopirellula polymerisocia]|uniref:Thioredoxin domain-containing protein n=1 Tax=Bythopirellula polymerisocia TaxID=2528003 RepID=A0A5C6D6L9_9BACT|nr:nitrophenyl compound nitroreductase subunit ArsF family protein [Bythopirellula polymerisocia]TWU30519.1 hypothetical protein Pla144_13060 [Bythopirellula polymerisocia]
MTAKNLLAITLLLFVIGAIATIVLKEADKSSSASMATNTTGDAPPPANGIVVYYFHGETRCPTCRNIEAYAHEAIQSGFSKELDSESISWQVVNYEMPDNTHFATDYEVVSSTVVLVRFSQGKQTDWRNLMRVWELVGDKEAFVGYVQSQTQEMLDDTEG